MPLPVPPTDAEPSFDPRSWIAPLSPEPVRLHRRRGGALAAMLLLGAVIGASVFFRHGMADRPSLSPYPASGLAKPRPTARLRTGGAVRTVVQGIGELDRVMAASRMAPRLRADIVGQLRRDPAFRAEATMRVILRRDGAGAVTSLSVQQQGGKSVALSWDAQSAKVRQSAAQASLRYKVIRGEVDRISFYSSAVAAGMTDRLIPEFAAAFAHDIDFQREIAPGDIFQAVYSTDESAQDSQLLYVSLTTRQRTITLYRYAPASGGRARWFDGNGVGAARSLLRTPVDGARVSSSFGPRFHPVLRYTRLHRGVDFAVPIGTQVYASGDGVVKIAGGVRGYGNYLRIRHADGSETAYAHLSQFSSGIAPGATVQQGQLVALSGNSGLSSGPHLHYEVYIGGVATDPMQLTRTGSSSMPAAERGAFRKERDRTDRLRTGAGDVVASVSAETE